MPNTYKILDRNNDTRTTNTKVTVQVSGTLPQGQQSGGESQKFPQGYKSSGTGRVGYTWFTFTTSSQLVDIGWGIRSGCFDDEDSLFYQSDKDDPTKAATFTDEGVLSISKTASMMYQSMASQYNDGRDLSIDGKKIDLLGIINFKRSQYRDRVEAGSFKLNFRSSGSTYATATDDGINGVTGSIRGPYSNITTTGTDTAGSSIDLKIGTLYHDSAVALIDLHKMFFPSANDRLISNRNVLMKFLTGSTTIGTSGESIHKIGFFSGSATDSAGANVEQQTNKRATYKHCSPYDIVNFYSGSYSQSLNTITRDLSGIQANAAVNFKTKFYFCRALFNEFNYSNNPTFTTGSTAQNNTWRLTEPETFVTTIGLFNESNECLATGKLSQPLPKDFGRESVIRVRLDF